LDHDYTHRVSLGNPVQISQTATEAAKQLATATAQNPLVELTDMQGGPLFVNASAVRTIGTSPASLKVSLADLAALAADDGEESA